MKKIFIFMVMVALGLSMLFYTLPAEVRATVPKKAWNRYGSGCELTSVRTTPTTSVQKEVWNRYGSGFELTSVRTVPMTSTQKEVWNRYGSGFELSSVRSADEIKASIEKYLWGQEVEPGRCNKSSAANG